MIDFHGILPAIITPVDDYGRFQPAPFAQLVARLYDAGVHGLYVCGQTGEGLQMSPDQRKSAAEAAVQLSPPGKHVIVHVGAPATGTATDLARHASRAGAHAISSLPPAGSYSFGEIRDYYQAIAAASDVPLLIYYFPSMAPAIQTTDQVLELCRIPNVAGLKFTDSDFFRLWAIRQSGAVVFNGSDEMLVAGLITGANGGIGSTYNLMPEYFVELYGHAAAGRWEEARGVQSRINEMLRVLLRYPVNPAIKAVLAWTGIDCGSCIPPRRRLTAAEERDLRAQLATTAIGLKLLSATPK